MWIRRGFVVLSAIGLLLSPGVGGLSSLLEADEVCACGMGPDCPMCAARRQHLGADSGEARQAECRCRLTVPGDASGSRQIRSLQPEPLCPAGSTLWFTWFVGFAEPALAQAPLAPALETPRRPPRHAV